MEKAYYNVKNPGAYTGINNLARETQAKQSDVAEFLQRQTTYQLHKPRRLKFKRRKYRISEIDDLWQADLADVQNIKNHNNNIAFLLIVIDVFSKFLFVRPQETKQADETLKSMKDIIEKSDRKPRNLMTDKGTEFLNEEAKAFYKSAGINYYTAENVETKAAVAERVIRTLKSRMYKYMTHKNTKRYIDKLQYFVRAYNNSFHRTIKMKPNQVNEHTAHQVRQEMLLPLRLEEPKFKFKVNDKVRIAKYHTSRFTKGYVPQWTLEIFQIKKRKKTIPPTYKIADLLGENITGSFYEPEIQLVPEDTTSETYDPEERDTPSPEL